MLTSPTTPSESNVNSNLIAVCLIFGLIATGSATAQEDSYWSPSDMGNTPATPNQEAPEFAPPKSETGDSTQQQAATVASSAIMNVELSLATTGNAPELTPVVQRFQQPNFVSPKSLLFTPADVRHRRLLFEQPLLERHGLTCNESLQPFVSGAHFFGSALLFPFELAKHHHRWCDGSLGWGTPGSLQFGCQ